MGESGAPRGECGRPAGSLIEYPETLATRQAGAGRLHERQAVRSAGRGTVEYQYFMVDPGWTEDRWIKSNECLLGNRSIVHHIFRVRH